MLGKEHAVDTGNGGVEFTTTWEAYGITAAGGWFIAAQLPEVSEVAIEDVTSRDIGEEILDGDDVADLHRRDGDTVRPGGEVHVVAVAGCVPLLLLEGLSRAAVGFEDRHALHLGGLLARVVAELEGGPLLGRLARTDPDRISVVGGCETIREDLDDPLSQECGRGEVGVGGRRGLERQDFRVGDDLGTPEGGLIERKVLAEPDKFWPLWRTHDGLSEERNRLLAQTQFGEPAGLGGAGLGAVTTEFQRTVEERTVVFRGRSFGVLDSTLEPCTSKPGCRVAREAIGDGVCHLEDLV